MNAPMVEWKGQDMKLKGSTAIYNHFISLCYVDSQNDF